MLSSKNGKELSRQTSEKIHRFSIRRMKVGVVSVIATSMFLTSNNVAEAQEIVEEPAMTSVEVEEAIEEPVAVEASAETTAIEESVSNVEENAVAVEETTVEEVGNDETLKAVDIELVNDTTFGDQALEHVEYLSEEIGSRVVGTEGEAKARDYILNELKSYGYDPVLMPFEFVKKDITYNSSNIIAYKKGEMLKEVIVGAHYDSVNSGGSLGADDNASGVGVVLEMAQRLLNVPTKYSIKFVAFGAEEVGLQGSKAYAAQMSEEEINNTVAMINLDSLIAGDKMYIHAGLGGEYWVRDQAFDIAEALGIEGMVPNPGLNPEYPYGETGDWSDHAPFNQLGIPIMYFEGTNWNIGELDGYDQTEEFGPIFHTGMDSLTFLNENYPGRVEHRLYSFSADLYNLLINMTAPEDKPEADIPSEDKIPVVDQNENNNENIEVKNDQLDVANAEVDDISPAGVATLPETGEKNFAPVVATILASLGLASIIYSKKK